MELIMPNDSSDEMAKSKELHNALRSAQVPYTASETNEGLVFKVGEAYESQLMDATDAIGVETESFGADSEDDPGSGLDTYRTEERENMSDVQKGIEDVVEGNDPKSVLDSMIEGGNPLSAGGGEAGSSTKNKHSGKDGAKDTTTQPPRLGGKETNRSHTPHK